MISRTAMLPRIGLAIVTGLLTATCSHSTTTQPAHPHTAGQKIARCTWLTKDDLATVAPGQPSSERTMAQTPGNNLRCATLFIDGSGYLILQTTEQTGDNAALATLRKQTASTLDPSAITPLPTLGPGAFVAHRVLSFRHGDHLLTLQTGYSEDGHLELTPSQLIRLAQRAAPRITS